MWAAPPLSSLRAWASVAGALAKRVPVPSCASHARGPGDYAGAGGHSRPFRPLRVRLGVPHPHGESQHHCATIL
eukprot:7013041-Alexandrium_andersonii.AAC.1